MATTMRTTGTLNTSPVIEPASQPSDTYQYNNKYIPYFSASYYIIMTLHIMYIPFIIVSSSLVISAVILMKKHQSQHNIFLLAVGIYDLLIGTIVIPTRVVSYVGVTKETFQSEEYRGVCIGLNTAADLLELLALNSLTLLGLDTVFQLKYPLKYRKFASIKKALAYLVTIVLVNLCFITSLTYVRISTNCQCTFSMNNRSDRLYYNYFAICAGILLSLCFFSGIYVRYKRYKLVKNKTSKATTWLLMMFIIFYMPQLLILTGLIKFDKEEYGFWQHIPRLIRFLSSVTNGPLIFFFRPTYKFAFKYFIRTNPRYWNKVEKYYISRNVSSSAVYDTRAVNTDNFSPSGIDRESEKSTDCFRLNKIERNSEGTSGDCRKTSSRISVSNDRSPPQIGQEIRKKSDAENLCIPL